MGSVVEGDQFAVVGDQHDGLGFPGRWVAAHAGGVVGHAGQGEPAAAQHVPLPEVATGTGPGPFALADPAQTRATLSGAGFEAIEIEPFTTSMLLAGGGTLDQTVDFMVAGGSGRALLDPAPADVRQAAITAVRDILAPLADP